MGDQSLAVGVDIGGTRTKSGLVDLGTGEVLHRMVQPTEKKDAAVFLRQLREALDHFRKLASMEEREIAGVGIGVPGFVSEEGSVVTTYGFLDFMERYPLKAIVENELSLSCRVENDARVVALGEALHGRGAGFRRVLMLTLGTGVGFGFVVDGEFPDELPVSHMGGHMTITDVGERCYCGKTGCLESLVSAEGILKRSSNAAGPGRASSVEEVFAAVFAGDTDAFAVIEKTAEYLRTAIGNYINLFAPDIVVLGGGIAKGLAPYLDKMVVPTNMPGGGFLPPFPEYHVQLVVSALEESAGVIGGACLFDRRKR